MTNFWDERFSSKEYVYGTAPNIHFQKVIDLMPPGKILIPGEGEGRNAVYAAKLGWDVHAFDSSEEGRKKAMDLAAKKKVTIRYDISDYQSFKSTEKYDAIALIFTHMPPNIRKEVHRKFIELLKPNGVLIMQVFSKEQLGLKSGGPQDLDMLCSKSEMEDDFKALDHVLIEDQKVFLDEGPFHQGHAQVLSIRGLK